MLSIDPARLARRQLKTDRERTARFAHLFRHKVERMSASPLAFLRGSAPLFYELLDRYEALAEGPSGEGWIVGDAHLENFGAYRVAALGLREPQRIAKDHDVVFGLNDFDEAVLGPWRFDVLRLTTSFVLGAREIGADGPATLTICDTLLDAYVDAVFHGKRAPAPAPAVTGLIDRVRARTREELLDGRTAIIHGERRFVRGPRYRELPTKLRMRAERAFARYARRLPEPERPEDDALDVIDAAFRVAGTGSLGCIRIAVLVRGKGGHHGAWIFDMKEEGTPSAARLLRSPHLEPAERVCTAIHACLAQPPRMTGAARMRRSSMFVRRLAPQEDKLDLRALPSEDLPVLARHLGALLGAAHRRGAKRLPKKPWTEEDRALVLTHAIALAGMHEAAYLAYCELARR